MLFAQHSGTEMLIAECLHLLGVERVTFLLKLNDYGVAMIDLTESEILSDLANA